MTVRSLLFLLGLGMGLFRAAVGMEPLALLATQPVWQAGQPVTINVDYDGGLPSQRLLCHTYFFVFFVSASIWNHGRNRRLAGRLAGRIQDCKAVRIFSVFHCNLFLQ